ncbi:MAG: 2-amino-4-hydroxy-6-hydroxymethyldihydropteridine diphosphokinase [Planctomycetes bacterium]|nr:2-amino-4-hydroxy-6-hydroxymethyldihydropteridine diphosphokinase [Planctomycetota bacterium]
MLVHLLLGSNVGARALRLRQAVRALAAETGVRVIRVSSIYETPPAGIAVPCAPFLNVCVEIETDLDPGPLLARTEAIERALGRPPETKGRKLPRTIDIDILLAGGAVDPVGPPILPHPGLRERIFFLRPLLELAPEARDPVTGHPLREDLVALAGRPILSIRPWRGPGRGGQTPRP